MYTTIQKYFQNIDVSHISEYSSESKYEPLEMTYIWNLPSLLKHFYLFLYTYFTKTN